MSRAYPFYQVDVFASKAFEGNQACIMPLEDWTLSDEALQAIAAENNVAETAYIVPKDEGVWELRWFTPAVEVPLCGHATLASAHILFAHDGFDTDEIIFETRRSGALKVRRVAEGGYEMDFPASGYQEIEITEEVVHALGARPERAWSGPFYAAQFETADKVKALTPDLKALSGLGMSGNESRGNFGCFATDGEGVDVTSRCFAPGSGIDEDPATGSWHCMLAAIASSILGKDSLDCFQAYPGRGAFISTRLLGDRVKLTGQAVTVIEGQFRL